MANRIVARTGGAWRDVSRVYVRRDNKWVRVYGVYYWGAGGNDGRIAWWPMFDYGKVQMPAPTLVKGALYPHHAAAFSWNQVTSPFVSGYRVYMRKTVGLNMNVPVSQVYPDWNQPPFSVDTTSMTWGGMAIDTTYSFTIVSVDEFGTPGPESAPIHAWTGHASQWASNASGGQAVSIAPYVAITWNDASGWTGYNQVAQGRRKNAPVSENFKGCVSYDSSWTQMCNALGINPPRSSSNVAVRGALIQKVSRQIVSVMGDTVRCEVTPGSITAPQFGGGAPVRHPQLGQTWFQSPVAAGAKFNFNFAEEDALRQWATNWLGIGSQGYNGLILHDPNGKVTNDGTGHVKLNGSFENDWYLTLYIHYSYESVPLSSMIWA